jgi:hypothetical protein
MGPTPNVAVYTRGVVTVLQPGLVYAANDRGIIGGSVLTDVDNFIEQAALFRGSQMTLIPRQPDEVTSHVVEVSNSNLAPVSRRGHDSRRRGESGSGP